MDFGALPPEVNSARMYAGPGAGSMLAAAEAWSGLAADLQSVAAAAGTVISGLTDDSWGGPASTTMNAAVAPYLTWMRATAPQLEQSASQARAAAAAYEAAFAMTVPPPVIAANRAQLMALIAMNFLGINTAAIMATEAHYGEMWAQDAAAMFGYAANSAVASQLTPFTTPASATNPAGVTNQNAAAAQAAGTAAGNHAQNVSSSVSQTLQSLAAPGSTSTGLDQVALGTGTSAATSAVSTPASMLTGLTGATGKAAGKTVDAGGALGGLAAALPAAGGGEAGLLLDTVGFAEDGIGLVALDGGGFGVDFAGLGLDFLGADELTESGGLGALGTFPLGALGGHMGGLGAGLGDAGASASIGQASSVGTLSVPQTWADAGSVGSASSAGAVPLPNNGLAATPAASTTGVAAPKVTFPSLMEREADGMQRIGLRTNMLPRPLVG